MKFTSLAILLISVSAVYATNIVERETCTVDACARAIVGRYASPAVAIRSADCSYYLEADETPQMPYYAAACTPTGTVTIRYASACACLTEIALPTPASLCLSGPQATDIVNAFASLLTGPQAPTFTLAANALLASNFMDTSDSINNLLGFPLGTVTFPNKTAFIIGLSTQPAMSSLTTYDIFYNCNKIAWRWIASGIGSGIADIKGINTLTCNAQGQVQENWCEFNGLAWAKNYGNPECAP